MPTSSRSRAARAWLAGAALASLLPACTLNVAAPAGARAGAASAGPTGAGATGASGAATPPSGGTAVPAPAVPAPVLSVIDNHDLDHAMPVNVSYSESLYAGAIVTQGQEDYYRVDLGPGDDGLLRVEVQEGSSAFTPVVNFYGPDRTQLQELYAPSGTTTPYFAEQRVSAGHTYYFRIRGVGDQTVARYQVHPTLSYVKDHNEPNDDFDHATPVAINTAIPFYLFAGPDTHAGVDEDDFRFDLDSATPSVRVRIHNGASREEAEGFYLELRDGSRQIVDSFSGSSQADVDHVFRLHEARGGRYYLRIHSSGASARGAHSLTVSKE